MPNIDIKSGRTRRVGGGQHASLQAGNIVKLLVADPTRVALLMTAVQNGFNIYGDPSGSTQYGRVRQMSTYPPLLLDVETYGALVTGDIWADATTTPCTVDILAIVDTTYDGSRGYAGVS